MPLPVSLTAMQMYGSTRSSRASTRPPRGVNLTALESRFQTTCCKRAGSPVIWPISEGRSVSLEIQPELAADDAGRVEQVINQLRLRLSATLDDLRRMLDLLGVQPAVAQQSGVSEYCVQRRAQFMRHEREEFILHSVSLFGLATRLPLDFVKARVLDGQRDSVGRQFQQPDIVYGKTPGTGRVSVNYADETSFHDQRRADQ